MAANKIVPPEPVDFKRPELWEKWIRRFGRFRIASDLHKKSEEIQVNSLLYAMGDSADDVLTTFVFDEGDNLKYDKVKEKFDEYFTVRRNVIYERAKFNQRKQEQDESAETFITSLYCLAEYCTYGVLKEEMIRDRIVVGVRDSRLSEKMQLEPDLTLEKAVKMVRESESVKRQQSVVRTEQDAEIDSIRGKFEKKCPKKQLYNRGQSHEDESKNQRPVCWRCGNSSHFPQDCKAKTAECHKCSRKGHYARMCKNSKQVREILVEEEYPDNGVFLGEIQGSSSDGEPWKADIIMDGAKISFKLDCGADVTVISEDIYKTLPSPVALQPGKKLFGPCKTQLNCKGKFLATLCHDQQSCNEEIYVVVGLEQSLLGRNACQQLGIIAYVNSLTVNDLSKTYKEKFPKLFTGLGCIEGDYDIKLDETVNAYNLTTPRRIPIPMLDKVKKELERMERMGVIEPVDQPTKWCSPIVIVPKKDDSVRICGDFVQLNRAVQREVYPMPSTEETLGKLAGGKFFTKLDANCGFWQRKLSKESRVLTTFITPWGRYCFKRLPFGISSAPEHFQKVMQRILGGLPGQVCQVDDILVFGATQEQHDERLEAVLQKLEDACVTLNPKKCVFSQDKVEFLGHVVGKEGIQVDPSKVEAVSSMKEPTNVGELRRFLGIVNHVGRYIKNLADMTKPLRDLLCKSSAWLWGDAQQEAFYRVKKALVIAPTLAIYDPIKDTIVSADASSYGLGAILSQSDNESNWKPVAYISRAMTVTEQRYAQVEKEALAITWACERLSNYLVGKTFHIETDHKPLVPLLGSKNLSEMPPRIQRLRMRLLKFQYTISHVPGKTLVVADALSRAPLKCTGRRNLQEEEINLYVDSVISELPASDKRLDEIRERQREDDVCRQLMVYCREGWPDKRNFPGVLKAYWIERGEITIVKGLLMKGCRLLIPSCMRLEILERVHEGHQGITKCRERAKASVWWPGISQQIEDLVHGCRQCAEHRKDRSEPLIPSVVPEHPWQIVGTDLYQLKGSSYLIVVDYFSRYIEVALLQSSQLSIDIIQALKSIFARHGVPQIVRSDNGPQFNSAVFLKFAKDWGFESVTSSPVYAQSNGEVERAVQTTKNLLKKSDDPAKALLSYRSTPLANGYSPAELIFGRKIRSRLPVAESELKPKWPDLCKFKEEEEVRKQKQKGYFDSAHGVRELPEIPVGSAVWVKDMKVPATVTETAGTPRSYMVNTPRGIIRRNRKFLTTYLYSNSNGDPVDRANKEPIATAEPNPILLTKPGEPKTEITTRAGRVIKPPKLFMDEQKLPK